MAGSSRFNFHDKPRGFVLEVGCCFSGLEPKKINEVSQTDCLIASTYVQ